MTVRVLVVDDQALIRGGLVALLTAAPDLVEDGTPPFIRRFGTAYRAQIKDFVECVQHGRTPKAGGREALAAIRIGEAATRAAHERRVVCV